MARKFLRNLNVLNLLLLAATLGFAFNRLVPLIDSPVVYTPPRVKSTVQQAPAEPPAPAPSANPLDYTVIAEQNLFHRILIAEPYALQQLFFVSLQR